ncbi:MAG: DUF4838 domain-containing protein, partial [Planctomycetota bacterium]
MSKLIWSMLIVLNFGIMSFTAMGAEKEMIAYKGNTKGQLRNGTNIKEIAQMMSSYIKKVTGREIAVAEWGKADAETVFLLAEEQFIPEAIAEKLQDRRKDSFVIQYPVQIDGKKTCLLASRDERGYDFPVYYFLNKFLDVHWVGPGEIGEVIRENKDWQLPEKIDIVEEPDFEHRLWGDNNFNRCRPLLAGSGRFGFHHALGRIYTPEKYGDKYPDIYPLVNGKRYIPEIHKGGHGLSGWQPCVTSPNSLKIALEYIDQQVSSKNRHVASIAFGVNDGAGNNCECKNCTALDDPNEERPGTRFWWFYNKIIEAARKKHPGKNIKLGVLGYGPCSNPPVGFKVNKNVIVFIAHPTKKRIELFGRSGCGLAAYQYCLDNAYPTIRHYPHMLGDFVKVLKENGGDGCYTQIEHNWASGGPKTYVYAKMFWDTERDVDTLLQEYMDLAFGKNAGRHMLEYFSRWEEIYYREKIGKDIFAAISGWNRDKLDKHKHVRWDDINHFDRKIKEAGAAEMSEKERKRYEMFKTFYTWTRANLVQYLIARDFHDKFITDQKSPEQILAMADEGMQNAALYDEIWYSTIAEDRTGWYLRQKRDILRAVKKKERFADSLNVEGIRADVEDYFAGGMEKAFKQVSNDLLKSKNKEEVISFWKSQADKYKSISPYIHAHIKTFIKKEALKDYLVNGNFENGTPGNDKPGNPPKLPGWWFYDNVGSIESAVACYSWKNDSFNSSKTIGCGPGKYPGLRQFFTLDPGIYRFSFWYKTVNRDKRKVDCSLYKLVQGSDIAKLDTAEKTRKFIKNNDNFIKFLRSTYAPTEGEWVKISRTFSIDKKQSMVLNLEPFIMPDN